MKSKLPGWVVDHRTSVLQKVEPYRHKTPEQRALALWDVCEASAQVLALNRNRKKVLAMQDPLPESTVRALARLRAKARG